MRLLRRFLIFGIGLYILAVVFLYLTQERWVYWPSSKVSLNPGTTSHSMPFEEVSIFTSDGVRLSGWFIPGRHRAGLIFFHGSSGNIADPDRLEYAERLYRLGFDILLFDYRGYGKSQGEVSEEGTYIDAEAVWNYMQNQRGFLPENLVLLGRGLGGAIATNLASNHTLDPPACLLLESTFTSLPEYAKETFSFFPIDLIAEIEYNTLDRISIIDCPVLIAHDPADKSIPFEHGRKLYEFAQTQKEFIEIHVTRQATGAVRPGDDYFKKIDQFLRTTVNL